MSKILRMPLHLANQIAAGEVVERPSSVVKELVENAVDAGARRIVVAVSDGGRTLRVTDDGEGMSPEDAALAFERFATSKLRTSEDLMALDTLGFRGEALASIAAVSRVECLTRARGSEAGTRIRVADGVQEVGAAGCQEGTTMVVSELFYNTPARLKFLRSESTEVAHVTETVQSLALAHPGVGIRLLVNDREIFDSSGSRELLDAVALVLGAEVASRMLPVHASCPVAQVVGLVSPPEMLRSDRNRQWLFVNGRPVRHGTLAKAVEEGYRGQVPASRYPWYVLSLRIDADRLDVNVHPAKREVRLADGSALFHLVRDAVLQGLRRPPEVRAPDTIEVTEVPPQRAPEPAPVSLFREPERPAAHHPAAKAAPPRPPALDPAVIQATMPLYQPAPATLLPEIAEPQPGGLLRFPFERLRILGQLHETYIVTEHPEGLFLVDQHNSHERYLYEQLEPAQVLSQELLLPVALTLSPIELAAVSEFQQELAAQGFMVEPFGEDTWVLRAVPAILPMAEAEETLRELLAQAAEGPQKGALRAVDREDRWRVSVACHAAVKAGQQLSYEEMQQILDHLKVTQQPMTCPHGRPTGFLLTKDELDRKVLRHYPGARRSRCE